MNKMKAAQQKITDRQQEILDGIESGMTLDEIAIATGTTKDAVSHVIQTMLRNGVVQRIGAGRYRRVTVEVVSPKPAPKPAPFHHTPTERAAALHHAPVEHNERRVQISDFLKERAPFSLSIERSPTRIDDVIKLEICIGGIWFPVPYSGNLRVCVGEERPRWSPEETWYEDVTALRVTFASGRQNDYSHNPNHILTVMKA